ncbi:cytochrome c [Motiliproteus sp. MSK22-1]|uniref:c-type cytochrome n=1 Tax=Motiliproteus sp. MSK22-1 TaxID=1897630 RepID=UPI0013016174|nr:cytochrome c [Motiliproteus sp. MSK22-1]
MKKRNLFLPVMIATMAFGSSLSSAADIEKTIEARQSFMRVYSFNLGLVGDMAKGKSQYDAEIAANAAKNLLALAKMDNGPMWPQGTSKEDPGLSEKTRALPETWTTYPKVSERHKELTEALEKFVNVAGKDLASLRMGIKDVGKGCKGCHESFRAEEEE